MVQKCTHTCNFCTLACTVCLVVVCIMKTPACQSPLHSILAVSHSGFESPTFLAWKTIILEDLMLLFWRLTTHGFRAFSCKNKIRHNDPINPWLRVKIVDLCSARPHWYEINCRWHSCQSSLCTGGHFFTQQPSEGGVCFWPSSLQLMSSDRMGWCFSFKSSSEHKQERNTGNSNAKWGACRILR